MAKIFRDEDASLESLRDKVIAVVGYGSQGRAQALNLRDSGLNVTIGLRPTGSSWKRAKEEGFEVKAIEEAVSKADVVLFLIPDMSQPQVFEEKIKPNLRGGRGLCFAHAFNIHYGLISLPEDIDVFMVAPKAPGIKVREAFTQDSGVPALVAVLQNPTGHALEKALAVAKGIGVTRIGCIETTFKEEVETDLIGEQCVLVGGLVELIKNGFEVLTEHGYQPEVAYFEVLNEAKLIMDLIHAHGMTGMLRAVSDTAKYGGLTVGPKVLDDRVKENMEKAAAKVLDGSFTEEWIREYGVGGVLERLMGEISGHQIELVGRKLRRMAGME